ncbi:MAG: recombinase family protein [Eubacteriales bacterium]|nr:recombinase family protein [Eubacteriales bacterium]
MSLRAVIYARCSTEEESQKDALVKQAAEARECVEKKGWILVDSYIESKSGTSTKGRCEYNRLYDDLCKNKFDIIVIKSQDRLMRNTKDWYLFVDRLTVFSKRLYIYIEQKFYTADDSLLTGIKAILAEDYSRELSKKINNAHYNRQKNGGTVLLTNNTYGYRKMPDKSVVIEEGEACIKRRMYELCAAGYGSRTIANILKAEGILNRRGNPFSDGDIRRMIRNPLNKGTAVMRRAHYDFDSRKHVKVPEEEQFVYENKVPAIVSAELWQLANDAISRRAVNCKNRKIQKYGKNPGKTKFSGKIVCGICGGVFYRTTRRTGKDGARVYEWKCSTYLQGGKRTTPQSSDSLNQAESSIRSGCSNIHLKEDKLNEILWEQGAQKNGIDWCEITCKVLKLLKKIMDENSHETELDRSIRQREQVKAQINTLLAKLLDGVISDEVYRAKQRELENSLDIIQEKIKSLKKKNQQNNLQEIRITEIEKYLKEEGGLQKAALAWMLDGTEKILVYPDHLDMIFSTRDKVQEGGIESREFKHRTRVELGNTFDYLGQKREEREAVAELIKENPQITVKQIAQTLNITLSGANYRIKVLKKEGRIRFQRVNGKGQWETLDTC